MTCSVASQLHEEEEEDDEDDEVKVVVFVVVVVLVSQEKVRRILKFHLITVGAATGRPRKGAAIAARM